MGFVTGVCVFSFTSCTCGFASRAPPCFPVGSQRVSATGEEAGGGPTAMLVDTHVPGVAEALARLEVWSRDVYAPIVSVYRTIAGRIKPLVLSLVAGK